MGCVFWGKKEPLIANAEIENTLVKEGEWQVAKNGKIKRRVRWPDAAARQRRIFGDKVLPNLVLLARELERY